MTLLSIYKNIFSKLVSFCIYSLTGYNVSSSANETRGNAMGLSNRLANNSPIFGGNLRGTRGSHFQNSRSPTPSTYPPHFYRPPIQSPLIFSGPKPYRAPSFSPVPIASNSNTQSEYQHSPIRPLQPPSPFELAPPPYEYVCVPFSLEHPSSSQYVIYDDGDENTLSTAEIIQRQSQDYVDEQLAQFEMMTIAKLQGKPIFF